MNEIEDWYDNVYNEWTRLDRHKVEYEITRRYMDQYIVGNNLEIFDIGGGPGRYAIYLAMKGHDVTLLDLSGNHIKIAQEKAQELGVSLAGYIKGNALELEAIDKKYDVILLMGPLYHLLKESDRKKAVEGALALLKPGGIIIAAFISKYAPMLDCYSRLELDGYDNGVEELLHYLEDGENKEGDGTGFTTAYFTGIDEARDFMNEFGLKELAFAGVENILSSKEQELMALPEEEFNKWLNLGFALSQDKNLLGMSHHFLYIGRK
ncbi:MAG: Methyltransferase type 11 [Anaerocolumna sp.]|nr:Methyltransferase type 11 [Anaerocolumna sp.]